MSNALKKIQKGFTLIELLVVIGILGILLAIVLIAINPAAQFAQADNTSRANDVNTILNAVHQFAADNRGTLPTGIDTTVRTMCAGAGCPVDSVDFCGEVVPDYVSLFPVDPSVNNGVAVADCAVDYDTGYTIVSDTNGRVTVAAPSAEAVRGTTPVIQVTR